MAGIYIHIPFCKTRCAYCDFYSVVNETRIDSFVDALCVEARHRKGEIPESATTVYFGGGTPSRLRRVHFEKIFDTLYTGFTISPSAEITVEANPDDLSDDYVEMLSQLPVNRLSIGIQSFNDAELRFLSRRHSARQAIEAVERCRRFGFENISIDLMYGLPQQTNGILQATEKTSTTRIQGSLNLPVEIWQENLNQAIALDVPHISAYHLIYEENTRMYKQLKAGSIQPVGEEVSNAMFAMLTDQLTSHGYIHYEISAFGREGYFSQHNCSYWKNEKYTGLGPAAHSFDGDNRSWNVSSINRYINAVGEGYFDRKTEQLSEREKYNEMVFTGLRTIWGVDLTMLKTRFGEEMYRYCVRNAQKYIDKNLLKTEDNRLKLTRNGIFISDGIMSDLMRI